MSRFRRARIFRPTPRNLVFLAHRLRAGELVAVPTETVYGLAANALDARACAKIFRVKGRPANDPLIVHVRDLQQLAQIAVLNTAVARLARKFWPGALTIVLTKLPVVSDIVTSGRPSVAVRVPAHRIARQLLDRAGVPLAAPSANPFGYVSPTTAEHVRENLGRRIDYILDGGPCSIGLESTILDLRDPDEPTLLRPGAITRDELAAALGRRIRTAPPQAKQRASLHAQLAPGMLARHYSPHTPVVLHERLPRSELSRDEAYVHLGKPPRPQVNEFWFDARGNLAGVARRLFATLRRIDAGGFKSIHVELARGDGLAEAINDRLRRAAAK